MVVLMDTILNDLFPSGDVSVVAGNFITERIFNTYILLDLLVYTNAKVFWIDNADNFRIETLHEILQEYITRQSSLFNQNGVTMESFTDRVAIFRVFDTSGLLDAIESIKSIVSQPNIESWPSDEHSNVMKSSSSAKATYFLICDALTTPLSISANRDFVKGIILKAAILTFC